jgi:hypothetical protein
MDFFNLVCARGENAPPCALDGWVANLPNVFPASLLKDTQWGFAVIEAGHLIGLALLGGCVILLNLRLLGAGLTNQAPAELERSLRPWLWVGVALVLASGVLIGMLNPEKLYTSPAFFAKMIAMIAALIFSFGVTNTIATNDGQVPRTALVAGVAAFAFWLWSIGVFSTSTGANPGAVHLVFAGYALLLAFGGMISRLLAIGAICTASLVYAIYGYLVLGGPYEAYDPFMSLAKWCVGAAALFLVGLFAREIFLRKPAPGASRSPIAKLAATFSILAWVTAGAAGRWIGLS